MAQHTHRIIVHAGGPISTVSADALAADTAQVVACASIARHAERHCRYTDALHQVFELRIDGRSAIGVSRFGRGLIRSIPQTVRYRCLLPPAVPRSSPDAVCPNVSSWVMGAGRVAMEITIFGVGFGTHTPQIATRRCSKALGAPAHHRLDGGILFGNRLFKTNGIDVQRPWRTDSLVPKPAWPPSGQDARSCRRRSMPRSALLSARHVRRGGHTG